MERLANLITKNKLLLLGNCDCSGHMLIPSEEKRKKTGTYDLLVEQS